MRKTAFFLFLGVVVLWGCSKDEPSQGEEQQVTMTGQFIDSAVQGLYYETETHSGYTDESGNYDYEKGETVTFYVGDILLGSALATGELSPLDIATTADATINTLEVQNIAAFLQTLDSDGDPSNGIAISSTVANALSLSEIDFTQNIIQVLGEIALEVFQETGISLEVVYPGMAAAHLAQSLEIEFEPADLFVNNFVPIFSDAFGHNTRIFQWIHEFDNDGKLIKSTKYEKYPTRILGEYTFSDYTDSSVKMHALRYEYYRAGQLEEDFLISFTEDYTITMYQNLRPNYSYPVTAILELDSEKFLKKTARQNTEGDVYYRREYFYDEEDYLVKFVNSDFQEATNVNFTTETSFTYTDFGDLKTEMATSMNGTMNFEYNYRDDHSLESLNSKSQIDNSETQTTIEYDEQETILKDTTLSTYSNGQSNKTIEVYENGILSYYEWHMNGVLYQKSWYEIDGQGSSYLVKTELYNEDGSIRQTSCYDSGGNSISCT
ncbi:hypothetical protein [Christiangramia flava]|uniref:Uncharacterized protein n=1 Tax=Christiangramia flava JLT2011 TaxID=1229726 RepID=A0A1L7I895_9FLAO|nr:hypothetical protein [Christiangramia flava]APU69332.1 hypothetical protein GRFL_2608 [Christiangramia flava JLT2011]OSS38769.1 Autotransporter adhesin [Christiangramia flava JLT2011]